MLNRVQISALRMNWHTTVAFSQDLVSAHESGIRWSCRSGIRKKDYAALLRSSKSLHQVAALPIIKTRSGIEILLITTRKSRRWILPRGWATKGLSLSESAAREAAEEAGVIGQIDDRVIGTYDYRKRIDAGYDLDCHVFVYPLHVLVHQLDWKERGQREVFWCPIEAAVSLVEDDGLSNLLSHLSKNPKHPYLTEFISRWEYKPWA
ncbi:MAG: NUDIX hydrolase [Rhodospirillaceae bacterium]|nr:NUDIX hydrolase [Rhodospirillaceae bacterium]